MTFTQKAANFMKENNLNYSPELFSSILENIKKDDNNIVEENKRVSNLNNQIENKNYNLLNNICYSRK
jgi:hypothetical protein